VGGEVPQTGAFGLAWSLNPCCSAS